MNRLPSPNHAMLLQAATALAPLLDEIVFVGGHVTGMLVTDKAAPRLRETDDVDVIVQVTTYPQYQKLGERLGALGFTPDTSDGAPTCRWLTPARLGSRTKVDVMPTGRTSIGPTNRWYALGMQTRIPFQLSDSIEIHTLSAPAFLATKWDAFASRGNDNPLLSPDVEDILAVVAGRASLLEELVEAPAEIRACVGQCTRDFLGRSDADDAIEDANPDARFSPGVSGRTRARLEAIAGLAVAPQEASTRSADA